VAHCSCVYGLAALAGVWLRAVNWEFSNAPRALANGRLYCFYRPDAGRSTGPTAAELSGAHSSASVSSSSSPSSLYVAYLLLHVMLSVSTRGSAGCTKPHTLPEPYRLYKTTHTARTLQAALQASPTDTDKRILFWISVSIDT